MDVLEARRSVGRVDVVTGEPAAAIADAGAAAEVVYAAGSLPTLRACADAASAAGVSCQVALERPLTCATGLCRGCPVPLLGDDGARHVVRDCVEGPVFRAGLVDWAAL
jgi:dihydroorotate dehydrogenase electron transfer subunit